MWHRLFAALAMSALAGMLGCGQQQTPIGPVQQALELQVAGSFDNDYLHLKLDDQPAFDGFVTSSPLIGLACVISTTVDSGTHLVEARLGELVQALQFEVHQKTYVVVVRNGVTGGLYIYATNEPPGWD